jgi:hypothetical protein
VVNGSPTIREAVLEYFLKGHGLTARDAYLMFGTMRIASVVHFLRIKGYPIQSTFKEIRKNGKYISRYCVYVIFPHDLEYAKSLK